MKNTIFIILGLGGLYYFFKKKNVTPSQALTPTPTAIKPTAIKTTNTKPTTTKPKVDLTKTPLPPPAFKINDILKLKIPFVADMSYELPFGKTIGNIKEGIYLGYSPVYSNWIKLRATYYTGIYKAPMVKDVWVRATNWIK